MEPTTYCKKCKLGFATWEEFQVHLKNSDKHIACEICDADFKNEKGLQRHKRLTHAAEQDLPCKDCGKRFTRVGGMIGHVESGECAEVHRKFLENKAKIDKGAGAFDRIRAAAAWGRVNDGIRFDNTLAGNDEKVPSAIVTPRATQLQVEVVEQGTVSNASAFVNEHTNTLSINNGKEEDLIMFDVLNAPWDGDGYASVAKKLTPVNFDNEAFPPLGPLRAMLNPLESLSIMDELPSYQKKEKLVLTAAKASIARNEWKGEATIQGSSSSSVIIGRSVASGAAQSRTVDWGDHQPAHAPLTATKPPNSRPETTTPAASRPLWDFPRQTSPTAASSSKAAPAEKQSAWTSQKILFPDAPAAVPPPAALLAELSTLADKKKFITPDGMAFSLHDPKAPGFKAQRYYVTFTGKYKCPHLGCTKSVASLEAFAQHLKAPAHIDANKRLMCVNCLRFFDSVTALTQHAEAQGIRCRVRETDGYENYIGEITAKAAKTDGFHSDSTVKYAVGEDFISPSAQMVLKANAEALKNRDKEKAEFWKGQRPKW